MQADRGELVNDERGTSIARWSVDLDDLAAASASIPELNESAQLLPVVQAKAVIYSIPKSIREKVISLHERLGHANTEAMCDALSGDSPAWTHSYITPAQVRRVMRRHRCLICLLSKRPRPPISAPSGDRRNIPPGSCLSGDIVPVSPAAYDGSTMYFLFADVATGYLLAFVGKAKDSFLEAFKQADGATRSKRLDLMPKQF